MNETLNGNEMCVRTVFTANNSANQSAYKVINKLLEKKTYFK